MPTSPNLEQRIRRSHKQPQSSDNAVLKTWKAFRKLTSSYVKPRSFEQSLYERLGMRTAKKAVELTGKAVLYTFLPLVYGLKRMQGRSHDEACTEIKPQELLKEVGYFMKNTGEQEIEKKLYQTLTWELTHMAPLYALVATEVGRTMLWNLFTHIPDTGTLVAAGLLAGNTYLGLLQRYHRSRLYPLLDRLEKQGTNVDPK